ncbi:hypothetical protein LTR66_004017 [Elasticomyces elasticus]|nr:hypothetical protein LTR66_004017 [Elasticomyces elasticus]
MALVPTTGGIFTVHLTYKFALEEDDTADDARVQEVLIWDFKTERCFPETKILKQKVRNHIEPGRDLGHSDNPSAKIARDDGSDKAVQYNPDGSICEDCR